MTRRARGKVLPGRENRADQRLRAGHHLSRPADQGQHEQPRVQLAREVTQLADVTLVKGPPGGVGEHVPPGELGPHLRGAPPQLTERPVLGLAQRRDRTGQAH